jgi:glycerate 2-kinase
VLTPRHLLIATGPFPPSLPAAKVAAAIARGLCAAGGPTPDLCPLQPAEQSADLREQLDTLDFDTRMRAARALVIATERLEEQTLAGSPTFELATRVRQAGVPAYAVTATNALAPFDARILDLQLILEATGTRALANAGRKLAALA